MKVELLHYTPLWVSARAIRKCWASEGKSDTDLLFDCCYDSCGNIINNEAGDKDKELIARVGNKFKHKSTLEHLVYSFDIEGISRACLQELARHRVASYSVKSTRYTLKELKNEDDIISRGTWSKAMVGNYVVLTDNNSIDNTIAKALHRLQAELREGISNDIAKYMLPEAYRTSLVMTINARSLQNFLELRTGKSALWEIQELAREMYAVVPDEHKYLFEEYVLEGS